MRERLIQRLYDKEQFVPSSLGALVNPYFFIRNGIAQEVKRNARYLSGRVLDFGCGSRPYESLIRCKEYIGLDFEAGHDHRDERIDVYYDGKTIPFPNEHFDAVFSSEVFEHLFNVQEIITELHRVMKNGGHILLTMPFVWDEHEIPYDFCRYTSFGIRHLLEKGGFEIVQSCKTGNYVQTIFQMAAAYVNQSVVPVKVRKIVGPFLVAPIILMGILFSKILPKNENLYLNNVIVAKKLPV